MSADLFAAYSLLAQYGFLVDSGKYEEWLDLFSPRCSYYVKPRENHELGLDAALIYCDSRSMLEDRIQALRIASKYNIHNDRHIIGLPRIVSNGSDGISVEAPFAVYQTEQEGDTRLFATGLYRDRLERSGQDFKISEKMVLVDSFAIQSLLATPL
ncbi:MAG: anthranilate 1,2-dioxygenase small subunit [Bradyrhizobium sp.]|jgi:anthranilate 1,2-dioxygenase small subunit|nr:anthranilate 1,2-dioxygenase small subunit [Bradyrhizobium sp.]